jgi:multidrug efflux system membrane fusion protein
MPPQNSDGSDIFGYRAPPPPRRSWTRTLFWIVLAVGLAVLVGWGLTLLKTHNAEQAAANGGGFGGGGPGGPGGPPGGGGGGKGGRGGGGGAPTTVNIAKAAIGSVPITVDALGTVTPLASATVTSRVSGNLDKVFFKEGQVVRKGQRLAQIDPRPYEVAVQQAVGTLQHDQQLLAQAQMDLKRYQTLVAEDSIAKQTAEDQAALVKQDQATVVSDKAALDNAKLNLAYCTITAPADGLVGLRKTDPGNFVTAGSTSLVVLDTINPIDVLFALPEDELPALTARLRAGAQLPVTAYDRARINILAQGRFATLDNTVDTTTGTVHAKARYENSRLGLYPDQFVNVRVLVDTLTNVVTVPTSAVRHGAPGDFVYTVGADHLAHVRVVKLGAATGETIAILGGLNAGETVVTEGGDRLRDGGRVILPGETPKFGAGRKGGRRGGAALANGGQASADQASAAQDGSGPQSGAPGAYPHAGSGRGAWAGHHRQAQGGTDAAAGQNP